MTIKDVLYRVREARNQSLFNCLARYCQGHVLDVGGGDFFTTVTRRGHINFDRWTSLEPNPEGGQSPDHRYRIVAGDGCAMKFDDGMFDTVLNIQVLEHVPDPFLMLAEMARVTRPGGHLVMLVPQTSALHMVPHHYYNFTRFWVVEACRRSGLELLELTPQGGVWSSVASAMVYMFLKVLRVKGFTTGEDRRQPLFWLLLPLMVVWALLSIPVCLLFSLADLTEEPNNWLVVARKPEGA